MLVALVKRKRLLMNEEINRKETHESHFFKARFAKITGTTSGTPTTQTTHAHGLSITPLADQVIIVAQDKSGSIYLSAATDGTNIYVKCDIATVAFTAIILYEV